MAPTIGPRPTTPPSESWPGLVDYLVEIIHVIHTDRHIPKYQFERHVDSLLVPFLPEIMEHHLGGAFQFVAAEFPLKKPDNNQSTNADGLLYQSDGSTDGSGAWWLFELKTDQHSVMGDQLEIYREACKRPMSDLVSDLDAIATKTASYSRGKYQHLINLLSGPNASFEAPVRLVYLSPHEVPGLKSISEARALTYADVLELELTKWPEAWRLVRDHLLAPIVKN